jgi:hypothetical protein
MQNHLRKRLLETSSLVGGWKESYFQLLLGRWKEINAGGFYSSNLKISETGRRSGSYSWQEGGIRSVLFWVVWLRVRTVLARFVVRRLCI